MDFLDEVKQELSEEKLHKLIKKYSPLVFGMMLAVIIGIVGGLWWKSYKADKIFQDGGQYVAAITKMKAYKPDDAISTFEGIANNNTAYGMFAALNVASFKHYKKDYNEAQKWYSEVESNSSYDTNFRELATLMKIKAMSDSEANVENTTKLLEDYIKRDSAFKYSAIEFLASIYINKGQTEKAAEKLDLLLTDTATPASIKERAEHLKVLTKK